MSSGVKIDNFCLDTFNQFKLGRKYGAVVYRISDDLTEIIVDSTLPYGADFNMFLTTLPDDGCRYVVYDFKYLEEGSTTEKSKLLFVSWAPSKTSIKQKVIHTTSKDSLRKAINGVQTELQACDYSEISQELILKRILK